MPHLPVLRRHSYILLRGSEAKLGESGGRRGDGEWGSGYATILLNEIVCFIALGNVYRLY